MSFFSFGQSAEIDIVLKDAETRKKAEHKTEDGKKDKYFLLYDGETVSGKVNVTLKNPGKRLEHQGIKMEFIGQIGKSVTHQGCHCQNNLISYKIIHGAKHEFTSIKKSLFVMLPS